VHTVSRPDAEHVLGALESGLQVEAVVRDDGEVRRDVVVVAAESVLVGDDAVGDLVAVGAFQILQFLL